MIIPTPKLLLVTTAGSAVIVLSASHAAGLIIGLLWLAAMVILALVDASMTPRRSQLHWVREHNDKLSLGIWNAVRLTLHTSRPHPVVLQVRDAAPRLMASHGATRRGECAGAVGWQSSYSLFPVHRGDFRFGPVTARYLGPLGLAWKQRSVDLDDGVKVYPNLQAIRAYEALVRLGHLPDMGLRASRRWGEGTEFERLRSYAPDDEYRRINWKATAKARTPIVVDYQTERSQNIIVALDCGRLMTTRPALGAASTVGPETGESGAPELKVPLALTRLDFSVNAALLLAYVSQEYGDRVGLLAFSDRIQRYLGPRPGRRQFVTITEALYDLEAQRTATNFLLASTYIGRRSPRRSLFVLFTDIDEPQTGSEVLSMVAQLARRHLPLVVTLRDPATERLATQALRSSRAVYERAVARQLLDKRQQTLASLRSRGALTLDARADALTPAVINRYLEVKGKSLL